jgi:hypothetical protein
LARLRKALGRYWPLLVLITVGLALRVLVLVVYPRPFWYDGDSGSFLIFANQPLQVVPHRPVGYVLVLKAFRPLNTIVPLIVLQHLLGLALAAAVYLLLARRGVARWLSFVAALPLVIDGMIVTLEHYVLADILALALVTAAVFVLFSRPVPGVGAAVASGLLLAAAWFTRPLTLPIMVVLAVYLIARRLSWRVWATFVVVMAIPYITVQIWASGKPSPYGSNASALYGRMANATDCSSVQLPPDEQALCGPVGMRPDWYLWAPGAPGRGFRDDPDNPVLRAYAMDVLRQRPGDYIRVVSGEIAAAVLPGVSVNEIYDCLPGRYSLPATVKYPESHGCRPDFVRPGFGARRIPQGQNPPATPLTTSLHNYARATTTPATAFFVSFVVAGGSLVVRRRGERGMARDAGILAVAAAATIVAPIAFGMYDPRYVLPALPLLAIAFGLGGESLRRSLPRRWRRRSEPPPLPPAPP